MANLELFGYSSSGSVDSANSKVKDLQYSTLSIGDWVQVSAFHKLSPSINNVRVYIRYYTTGTLVDDIIQLQAVDKNAIISTESKSLATGGSSSVPLEDSFVLSDTAWKDWDVIGDRLAVKLHSAQVKGGDGVTIYVDCLQIVVDYVAPPYIAVLDNPILDETFTHDSVMGYYFLGWSYIQSGASTGWLYRGTFEWDISSIPDNSSIQKVIFKYHGKAHNIDCHIHEMLGCQPSVAKSEGRYQDVFDEIGEGTIYADILNFPVVGTMKEIELSSDAKADLQAQLSSGWFAIGVQSDDENTLLYSDINAEEESDAIPRPTLYVEYIEAPPPVEDLRMTIKGGMITKLVDDGVLTKIVKGS